MYLTPWLIKDIRFHWAFWHYTASFLKNLASVFLDLDECQKGARVCDVLGAEL